MPEKFENYPPSPKKEEKKEEFAPYTRGYRRTREEISTIQEKILNSYRGKEEGEGMLTKEQVKRMNAKDIWLETGMGRVDKDVLKKQKFQKTRNSYWKT